MARKKPSARKVARTKPKFTVAAEARRRAREAAGSPPAERVIPDKRRKPPKHRETWLSDELL
jgi:hypothetical protein